MSGPILALRRAILETAQADAELAAAMGGHVRLHDEPPRAAEPVYGVFGSVTAKDWSTDTDRGHEQDLAVVLWAKAGSSRSALLAAERLAVLAMNAARARDPDAWQYAYGSAVARALAGDDPRPAIADALRLNPKEPLVLRLARAMDTDSEARWRRAAARAKIPDQ